MCSRASTLILLGLLLTVIAAPPHATAQGIRIREKIEDLEARARVDWNDVTAQYNLGIGYWSEKQYDAAELALRQAIALEPKFARAYLALGVLPLARGDGYWERLREHNPEVARALLEEARSFYRRAFLIDPLVDLAILGAVEPPLSERERFLYAFHDQYFHYEKGVRAIQRGHFESAHHHFEELLRFYGRERSPDAFLWFHALAAAHLRKFDEAVDDARRLFERSPFVEDSDSLVFFVPLETNDYRYLLATFTHRAGEVEDAIELYEESVQNDLGLYMAHVRLAEIYEELGHAEDAIRERRNAVNANPEDPSLWMDLGVTLGRSGRTREAEAPLLHAAAANPQDARLHYLVGLVQMDLGKWTQAREALERFIELAPSRYAPQVQDARGRLDQLAALVEPAAAPDDPEP